MKLRIYLYIRSLSAGYFKIREHTFFYGNAMQIIKTVIMII